MTYRLFGANGSPYSVKVRSYLRYKELEHVWLVRNSADLIEEHRRVAKLPLVPTLVTPTGEALQDSTPMLEHLERLHGEKSIYPKGAARFVCELLEEFGDEWGNKWMMHLRWYSARSELTAEVFARRAAAELCSGAPPEPEIFDSMAASFKQRMSQRSFTVGSNSSTAPIIEQSFLDSIQLLELHLKARPYLFGGCPSLADFGLWGQLYQCFSDVLAGELIRLHAPKLALWCEVMANPKWLGDFEAWEDLAPTLEPFLASQVALFLRWSDANAKALLAGQKEFSVDLGGRSWTQTVGGPQKYHAKTLQEVRRKFQVAQTPELRAVLERCGCLELLERNAKL